MFGQPRLVSIPDYLSRACTNRPRREPLQVRGLIEFRPSRRNGPCGGVSEICETSVSNPSKRVRLKLSRPAAHTRSDIQADTAAVRSSAANANPLPCVSLSVSFFFGFKPKVLRTPRWHSRAPACQPRVRLTISPVWPSRPGTLSVCRPSARVCPRLDRAIQCPAPWDAPRQSGAIQGSGGSRLRVSNPESPVAL